MVIPRRENVHIDTPSMLEIKKTIIIFIVLFISESMHSQLRFSMDMDHL